MAKDKKRTEQQATEAWPLGRYRLQAPHYMAPTPQAEHLAVLREGAEVSFAGRPSQAMTPLDAAAKQAVARREAERDKEREVAAWVAVEGDDKAVGLGA